MIPLKIIENNDYFSMVKAATGFQIRLQKCFNSTFSGPRNVTIDRIL